MTNAGNSSHSSTVEPLSENTEPEHDGSATHHIPLAAGLAKAMATDWAPAPAMPHPASRDGGESTGAASFARHREALSQAFIGSQLVIPAGRYKVRSNDTDYPFRAWSAFTWLTGETVEGAVLVLAPERDSHTATVYIREYAGPGQPEYFTDMVYGALWVGNVPTPEQTERVLGIRVRPLRELPDALRRHSGETLAPRGIDPDVDRLLPGAQPGTLEQVIDELKLVKDDWEIAQMQAACDATIDGFADVAAELPNVLAAGGRRGERWLEGTFWRRARQEGNDVGYGAVVGAGRHTTTLHWTRNDGDVKAGELLLADMGIEVDSLYTADVTRTMPVGGEWSKVQRMLYTAVLEAQSAGLAEVKAGADFLAPHRAAMWVLADHLHKWGVLPVPAEVSCADDREAPGAGLHRRYTLHGTSHMLGMDVHDCATAREELYRYGQLQAGYVLTVEPGLYFQPNDLTVPAEWRGIGIRIEDDVLVTDGAPVNLSGALPRHPDELTEWMRHVQSRPVTP